MHCFPSDESSYNRTAGVSKADTRKNPSFRNDLYSDVSVIWSPEPFIFKTLTSQICALLRTQYYIIFAPVDLFSGFPANYMNSKPSLSIVYSKQWLYVGIVYKIYRKVLIVF